MTEDLPGIIIALLLIFVAVRYFYPAGERQYLSLDSRFHRWSLSCRCCSIANSSTPASSDGTPSSGPLRGITAIQVSVESKFS